MPEKPEFIVVEGDRWDDLENVWRVVAADVFGMTAAEFTTPPHPDAKAAAMEHATVLNRGQFTPEPVSNVTQLRIDQEEP